MRRSVEIRRAAILAALIAHALSGSARTAGAQDTPRLGVIDGVVTDTSLVPLGDATVSFLGSSISVVTGVNGRFRVRDMKPGAYILIVKRIGFEASSLRLQLTPGDTARPSFALLRAATRLDTIAVKAQRLSPQMEEFEFRRKAGIGHFITQAEIDKRNVADVTDLLTMVPSVTVRNGGAFNVRTGPRPCAFVIFVDGVRKTGKIDDIALPQELAGIEVYSGAATIPLQYKPTLNSSCGVILLWTRVGT